MQYTSFGHHGRFGLHLQLGVRPHLRCRAHLGLNEPTTLEGLALAGKHNVRPATVAMQMLRP